jgi:site-specific DNA recombinase
MDMLDNLILNAFRQKIYTPHYIRDVINTYRKYMNQHGGEDAQRTKKLEAELREIEQAEAKLFEAIEKGVLELDERLKRRVQQHRMRRDTITAELATLQIKQQTPLQTLTPQKIEAVANVINKRFSTSTPFSRAYIQGTVNDILVTGDFLKVSGNYRTMANLVAANGQIDPTEKFVYSYLIGVPYGIRTRVTAVKGRCPGPLDEGD